MKTLICKFVRIEKRNIFTQLCGVQEVYRILPLDLKTDLKRIQVYTSQDSITSMIEVEFQYEQA
jgi:hypothetical protein